MNIHIRSSKHVCITEFEIIVRHYVYFEMNNLLHFEIGCPNLTWIILAHRISIPDILSFIDFVGTHAHDRQ